VLRTHGQIVWLDGQLAATFKTMILPSLPEAPNAGMLTEVDHVEKKRRQLQRYLIKLLDREETCQSEDFKKFLKLAVVSLSFIFETIEKKKKNSFRH